jgi:hypothetical protein
MSGGWRDWRPAIWLAMIGLALILLVNPPYIGAVLLGAAIGLAIRIDQRRRRRAVSEGPAADEPAVPASRRPRKRRR